MPGHHERPMGLPARIRAAVGYSDQKQADIAGKLGVSVSTLARWMAGKWMAEPPEGREPDGRQLEKLEKICRVPHGFLRDGFAALDAPDSGIDEKLSALLDFAERLRPVIVSQLPGAGPLPEPPDELVRLLQDWSPTARSERQPQNPPGPERSRGSAS